MTDQSTSHPNVEVLLSQITSEASKLHGMDEDNPKAVSEAGNTLLKLLKEYASIPGTRIAEPCQIIFQMNQPLQAVEAAENLVADFSDEMAKVGADSDEGQSLLSMAKILFFIARTYIDERQATYEAFMTANNIES